jgi:hypothetical protein
MSLTKSEIVEIAQMFMSREDYQSKINECGRFTSIIEMELESKGYEPKNITGNVITDKGSASHVFLTLPVESVSDAMSGPVIIDVALEQFCTENKADPETSIEIAVDSETDIPPVAVLTPSDKYYQHYSGL